MKADFTEEEKTILKGKCRGIARTLGVSHTKINGIVNNETEIITAKDKKIFESLKNTIEFFKQMA